MKILGLSGKIGAGKDTLAGELAKLAPPGWAVRRFGFADAVKDFTCQLWDIPREWADGSQADKVRSIPYGNATVREALIVLGTDCARRLEPDIWIRKAAVRLDEWRTRGIFQAKLAIFADVRFPNECNLIQSRGGRVIRLMRAMEIRDTESETALDNYPYFDGRIDNRETSVEQTARQALGLLQFWGWWK